MQKATKRNVVISAILAIMLCVSLIAGATFALFTSESKVNIAVTSGTVKVTATIEELKSSHPDSIGSDNQPSETYSEGFLNGTAVYDEVSNSIDMKNMVAGDKVTFKLKITNYSTVPVLFKTTHEITGNEALKNALVINVGGNGWARLDAASAEGVVVNTFDCSVEMPCSQTNVVIEEGTENLCSISFLVEAVQGNAQVDVDENVLYISTADEFMAFAESVDFTPSIGQSYENKTVYLTADIDLSGKNFKGIGYDKHVEDYFMGTFDGQGHTIYGIDFTNDECPGEGHEQCWAQAQNDGGFATAGLFNNLGGVVKNVTISGAKIKSAHYAGGIAAYCYPGAKMENCHVVDSEITSYTKEYNGKYVDGDKAGGIAGMVLGSTIKNCSVKNTTVKAYRDLGALVGCATSDSSNISNCAIKDVTVIVDRTHNYKNKVATVEAHNARSIIGRNTNDSEIIGCTGEANIICADYYVSTADEMMALLSRNDVKVVAFVNDIDMSGKNWTGLSGLEMGDDGLTILGNGYSVSNLSAPLVVEASGTLKIEELTIKNSENMTQIDTGASSKFGFGAFLQVMRAGTVTLTDCHVDNVKMITDAGTRVGGFIGVAYANVNVSNCTVKNCELKANGSIGGIIAQTGDSEPSVYTISNCSVTDTTLTSIDDRENKWKVGSIVGSANAGKTCVNNCTYSGNTLSQTNNTNPDHELFGRIANGGKLFVDGGEYIANGVIYKDGAYMISSAKGLVYCAETFNTGDTTLNKVFKLTQDIDMTGIEWNPWCNDQQYFNGVFDGYDFTISNLTINDTEIDRGSHSTGFIGRLGSNGVGTYELKNVIFDNATVSGYHNVGVAVGYNEFGTLNNVKVSNSRITATHVADTETQAACGDKAGALIGMCGPNSSYIVVKNCSATNCEVKAARDAAKLIGMGYAGCSFVNLYAINVTVTGVIGGCGHTNKGVVSANALIGNKTADGLSESNITFEE